MNIKPIGSMVLVESDEIYPLAAPMTCNLLPSHKLLFVHEFHQVIISGPLNRKGVHNNDRTVILQSRSTSTHIEMEFFPTQMALFCFLSV